MRARVCLQNGTLKIVDRKKHIFKLAQGEYIAPEKIENIYMRSDAVAQVFVHGDSLQVGPLCKLQVSLEQSPLWMRYIYMLFASRRVW